MGEIQEASLFKLLIKELYYSDGSDNYAGRKCKAKYSLTSAGRVRSLPCGPKGSVTCSSSKGTFAQAISPAQVGTDLP